MNKFVVAIVLSVTVVLSYAEEFADGATTPKAEEIRQFFVDKVYTTKYANGAMPRYDFRSSGTIYVNPSQGPSSSGIWSTRDGQICTEIRGASQCSDVRMLNGSMILRRANGEIVTFVPG